VSRWSRKQCGDFLFLLVLFLVGYALIHLPFAR